MARRFGSAMISNTDSILLVYYNRHIRVTEYKRKKNPIAYHLATGGPLKPGFGLSGDVHTSQTQSGEQN